MNNKTYTVLLILSLLFGMFAMCAEVVSAFALPENQAGLFSGTGVFAIAVYVSLGLVGVYSLVAVGLGKIPRMGGMSVWSRWLIPAGALLVVSWVLLFSPWQFVLSGPWVQIIFAAGFAQLTSLLLSPRSGRFPGWRALSLTLSVFLFPRIVYDVRLLVALSIASRVAAVLGYLFVITLMIVLHHPVGERLSAWLLSLRERLGGNRWLFIVLFWLSPIIYPYVVGADAGIRSVNVRFAVLLISLWVASFLLCEQKGRLVSTHSLAVNSGMLVFFSAVNGYILLVVDYPFGLYWSEGNRFYDYSLVFGQSLYNYSGTVVNPYGNLGRYGLWGVMFLFRDLPIWVHRLWNLFLQIVPSLLFAYLITRRIRPAGPRFQIGLWITLFFVVLAPLHPPFMLASIIIAWFAFDESPIKRGLSVLAAGYYVAISRFTWAFAPAVMGALIDLLLYYPHRKGGWLRRLLPTVIFAILGMAPGLYLNFGAFQSTIQGESLTGSQPLLWYRLLPNATLGPGVLLLTLTYTGPLLVFLTWWMVSKQWKLDIWQKLAIWGALLGFLVAGLVISTKIGGGGDLHNLDMYLVTLILVIILGVTELSGRAETMRLPVWGVCLVVLLFLFPIYEYSPLKASASESPRLSAADNATVQKVLSTIRGEVEVASQTGDVLFMDQRQLLTFGYIPAIPFVPEYEKKYMMDQAMAGNSTYFKPYYRDLANKRFSLVVTEILHSKLKGEMGSHFGEENDAFVTWVSNPTLCFYKPIYISKETNIMLLIPKANTERCEEYLK